VSNILSRFTNVVKAEWSHRTTSDKPDRAGATTEARTPSSTQQAAKHTDVESAWRVLELAPGATLDEVRAAHRALSLRYYPKTRGVLPDQANAAHTLLEALTDALFVLEEHLLPLPPGLSSSSSERGK
jgi:hypothetical protein